MKEDRQQVEKEEEASVLQQQVRRNVWKQSKENQREEQEFDTPVDQAQIQQSLRGRRKLGIGLEILTR